MDKRKVKSFIILTIVFITLISFNIKITKIQDAGMQNFKGYTKEQLTQYNQDLKDYINN